MCVLVGKPAPDFTAPAILPYGDVLEDFTLSGHLRNSYGVLFFCPLGDAFAGASEVFAYDHRACQLAALGAKLVGVSVGSAWGSSSEMRGDMAELAFPMVVDNTGGIARAYDVLAEDAGAAFRGTFLIDRAGVVRHQLVNDLPLGRNVDEAVRMLEALRYHEDNGQVCPADWRPQRPAGQPRSAWFAIESL